MTIKTHTPNWDAQQYQLIDSGEGYKLEKFGQNILIRPEPQAIWKQSLTNQEWEQTANAMFTRAKNQNDEQKGSWQTKPNTQEQWWINRKMPSGHTLKLRMGMTAFKHVGVFAEQAANWDYIQQKIEELKTLNPQQEITALNMFAYTGAASIAAAMAGAQVTHLDSVKQVNTWAKENAETSQITTIRYITDDATEFAARELRRQKKYHAIILDPPAYGRGPDGQKWILEQNIYEMLQTCEKMLENTKGAFLLLSLYSMGFSTILAQTIIEQIFGSVVEIEPSELYLEDQNHKKLPLGITLKVTRK